MDQYGVIDIHFLVRIKEGQEVRECFDVDGNHVNQVEFPMDRIFNKEVYSLC
jgi:hypothetical protein